MPLSIPGACGPVGRFFAQSFAVSCRGQHSHAREYPNSPTFELIPHPHCEVTLLGLPETRRGEGETLTDTWSAIATPRSLSSPSWQTYVWDARNRVALHGGGRTGSRTLRAPFGAGIRWGVE